ncbi:hypothetical protein AAG570_000828 [Ranatra chinensis]|uniref:Peptidase C1A papain C-terminal domain-containing protein n=1 Tax=Ranatra chinensis TaxID=642074 RepID=A0ABD0YY88_9HEMI
MFRGAFERFVTYDVTTPSTRVVQSKGRLTTVVTTRSSPDGDDGMVDKFSVLEGVYRGGGGVAGGGRRARAREAVVILGWGADPQGVPYWIVQPFWTTEHNSTLNILRGKNCNDIEKYVVAVVV